MSRKCFENKVKIVVKLIGNGIYFCIAINFLNMLNKIPMIAKISDVHSENVTDILINYVYTVVMWGFLILLARYLYCNFKKYKNNRRCGALNPFC